MFALSGELPLAAQGKFTMNCRERTGIFLEGKRSTGNVFEQNLFSQRRRDNVSTWNIYISK
jgi:hypothetical protein